MRSNPNRKLGQWHFTSSHAEDLALQFSIRNAQFEFIAKQDSLHCAKPNALVAIYEWMIAD